MFCRSSQTILGACMPEWIYHQLSRQCYKSIFSTIWESILSTKWESILSTKWAFSLHVLTDPEISLPFMFFMYPDHTDGNKTPNRKHVSCHIETCILNNGYHLSN